jgi:hypothetical protein
MSSRDRVTSARAPTAARVGWPAQLPRAALGLLSVALACGGAQVEATRRPPAVLDFILVPRPPPVVPIEVQPAQPVSDAVWVEGQWLWAGDHWDWKQGGWVVPPHGATLSVWAYSYQADGRVRFWPPTWLDAEGRPIPEPKMLASAQRRAR